MKFYILKKLNASFEEAISRVTENLKTEGFGIISEIDLKEKFQEKLEVDFRNYTILGACNPSWALQALQKEDKIGVLLPCNIIVQEIEKGLVEVAAINPLASLGSIGNTEIQAIADEIKIKLERVIDSL